MPTPMDLLRLMKEKFNTTPITTSDGKVIELFSDRPFTPEEIGAIESLSSVQLKALIEAKPGMEGHKIEETE